MRIRVYADLHLYISNDDIDRYDTTELLDLKNLLYTDPVDMLIFAGDLTHKVYSTDDRRFVNTMRFLSSVRDACLATNTKFRIIQGTTTHEGKVIDVLDKLYDNDPVLKCFTKVGYENINGLVFRYLPEPYFDNYTNFFQYAFSQPADITVFHGTINGVIPYLKKTDNPTNLPKSVIIESNDLINNTNLFSVGGHIHRHINIDNKIFYVNSLTTHNFSDIDNIKGFMEFIIRDNKSWEYKYIENHKAPAYHRIIIENVHTKRKEFIKALTKKYRVKITQKLEDDEFIEENKDVDFFADQSISIIDKIQKLTEEQGLVLTKEEICDYIR